MIGMRVPASASARAAAKMVCCEDVVERMRSCNHVIFAFCFLYLSLPQVFVDDREGGFPFYGR